MVALAAGVLACAGLWLGDCRVPAERQQAGQEADAAPRGHEALLRDRYITERFVKAADKRKCAVLVAKIKAIDVGFTTSKSRFIECSYDVVKAIRKGDGGMGRTILDFDYFVHMPDTYVSLVRKPLEPGRVCLVVLDFGKWPILERCIEVTGADDPLVRQVEGWLR